MQQTGLPGHPAVVLDVESHDVDAGLEEMRDVDFDHASAVVPAETRYRLAVDEQRARVAVAGKG